MVSKYVHFGHFGTAWKFGQVRFCFLLFFFLLYMYNFVLYQMFKGNNHDSFEHNGINLSEKLNVWGVLQKYSRKMLKKNYHFDFTMKNIKYN